MMPEMDGVETTKILRNSGIKIPIIALTANAVTGAKEFLLSEGMDDFLSKPIDKGELYRILSAWLPAEKIEIKKVEESEYNSIPESERIFKEHLDMIHGLSVEKGVEIVAGDFNTYRSTLEILMRETVNYTGDLKKFIDEKDIENFYVLSHGIKGTLSLIGASELSNKARQLENAANIKDEYFCAANLPEFTKELLHLGKELEKAFKEFWKNRPPFEIPPELPPILARLSNSMKNNDYGALYGDIDSLNELELSGALKDEIENLNSAVMIMNYKYAEVIIERILSQ
jgi:CheY-like chemotaxis protein